MTEHNKIKNENNETLKAGCVVMNDKNEILAKEIGFNEFQSVNKNFEYHIIFDASLQREQLKLLEELKKK